MQSLIGVFVPALVGAILKYGKIEDRNLKILVGLVVALVIAIGLQLIKGGIFDPEAFGVSAFSIYLISQGAYTTQKNLRGLK